jgi:hypothetical protein
MRRGIFIAIAQALLLLLIAGKYAWDRATLPAVWVQAALGDPELPVRGRYLALQLFVDYRARPGESGPVRCRLAAVNGRLVAREDANGAELISPFRNSWVLTRSVAFFIPEHATDFAREAAASRLFAEVTVAPRSELRPIRLAVR